MMMMMMLLVLFLNVLYGLCGCPYPYSFFHVVLRMPVVVLADSQTVGEMDKVTQQQMKL